MRILNVDVLICDRCSERFELRKDAPDPHHGYGMVTIRSVNSEAIWQSDISYPSKRETLSDREKSILMGLKAGKTNKMIGRELGISDMTVKVHVKAVLRKINVMNRTQAAAFAFQDEARGAAAPPVKLEAVISHGRTLDLCFKCMEALEHFMSNGKNGGSEP